MNLYIVRGSIDILVISILPIHEHGICFLLFISSLFSFLSVLKFSKYRSFTSLVKFILKLGGVFGAIVNRIVFLVSFSASLLLIYKNTTDFWVLIVYPATTLLFHLSVLVIFGGVFRVLYMRMDPKKQNLSIKNCVFILTCLNFSHLPSLHLMQYTYRHVFPLLKTGFELVKFDPL